MEFQLFSISQFEKNPLAFDAPNSNMRSGIRSRINSVRKIRKKSLRNLHEKIEKSSKKAKKTDDEFFDDIFEQKDEESVLSLSRKSSIKQKSKKKNWHGGENLFENSGFYRAKSSKLMKNFSNNFFEINDKEIQEIEISPFFLEGGNEASAMVIEEENGSIFEEDEEKIAKEKIENFFENYQYSKKNDHLFFERQKKVKKILSSNCTNQKIRINIQPKMLPFFFNKALEEENFDIKKIDLSSFKNSKKEVYIQIYIFQGKKNLSLSEFQQFKEKILNLHQHPPAKICNFKQLDFPAGIKMMIQFRLIFELSLENHKKFIEQYKLIETNPDEESYFCVDFSNQIEQKVKEKFNSLGEKIEEYEIKYTQNYPFMNDKQQKDYLITLSNHYTFKNVLKNAIRGEKSGIAIKGYTKQTSDTKVELRLDFIFPISSFRGFELRFNDIHVI